MFENEAIPRIILEIIFLAIMQRPQRRSCTATSNFKRRPIFIGNLCRLLMRQITISRNVRPEFHPMCDSVACRGVPLQPLDQYLLHPSSLSTFFVSSLCPCLRDRVSSVLLQCTGKLLFQTNCQGRFFSMYKNTHTF